MGNTPSARRRTHSAASAGNHRTAPPSTKSEKLSVSKSLQTVIDDSKFAPKKQIFTEIYENTECPICFLNYEALNEALCCKQMICTECYLLMKHTAIQAVVKCPCPFCSNEVLNIIYRSQLPILKAPPTSPVSPVEGNTEASSSPTPYSWMKVDADESSNDGSLSARACMRKVHNDVSLPKSSIDDRKDIEKEIQQQRLRYTEDLPPPLPPSSRASIHLRAGDAYLESLTQSFARRSMMNNADHNTSRGTMSDFEHASLRLRFAVAIGERSSERLSQRLLITQTDDNIGIAGRMSPLRQRRDQDAMADYLDNRASNRRTNNDLERIEEMMMMEAIKLSIESSPSSALPSPLRTALESEEPDLKKSSYSEKNEKSENNGKSVKKDGSSGKNENGFKSEGEKVGKSEKGEKGEKSVISSENNGKGEKGNGIMDEMIDKISSSSVDSFTPLNDKNNDKKVRSNGSNEVYHRNNFSDCESEGVSVIAWDDSKGDEVGKCSDWDLSPDSKPAGKQGGVDVKRAGVEKEVVTNNKASKDGKGSDEVEGGDDNDSLLAAIAMSLKPPTSALTTSTSTPKGLSSTRTSANTSQSLINTSGVSGIINVNSSSTKEITGENANALVADRTYNSEFMSKRSRDSSEPSTPHTPSDPNSPHPNSPPSEKRDELKKSLGQLGRSGKNDSNEAFDSFCLPPANNSQKRAPRPKGGRFSVSEDVNGNDEVRVGVAIMMEGKQGTEGKDGGDGSEDAEGMEGKASGGIDEKGPGREIGEREEEGEQSDEDYDDVEDEKEEEKEEDKEQEEKGLVIGENIVVQHSVTHPVVESSPGTDSIASVPIHSPACGEDESDFKDAQAGPDDAAAAIPADIPAAIPADIPVGAAVHIPVATPAVTGDYMPQSKAMMNEPLPKQNVPVIEEVEVVDEAAVTTVEVKVAEVKEEEEEEKEVEVVQEDVPVPAAIDQPLVAVEAVKGDVAVEAVNKTEEVAQQDEQEAEEEAEQEVEKMVESEVGVAAGVVVAGETRETVVNKEVDASLAQDTESGFVTADEEELNCEQRGESNVAVVEALEGEVEELAVTDIVRVESVGEVEVKEKEEEKDNVEEVIVAEVPVEVVGESKESKKEGAVETQIAEVKVEVGAAVAKVEVEVVNEKSPEVHVEEEKKEEEKKEDEEKMEDEEEKKENEEEDLDYSVDEGDGDNWKEVYGQGEEDPVELGDVEVIDDEMSIESIYQDREVGDIEKIRIIEIENDKDRDRLSGKDRDIDKKDNIFSESDKEEVVILSSILNKHEGNITSLESSSTSTPSFSEV